MSTAGDGGGESSAVLRLLPHRGRTTGCGGSHTGTAVRKTLTGRYYEKLSLVGTCTLVYSSQCFNVCFPIKTIPWERVVNKDTEELSYVDA